MRNILIKIILLCLILISIFIINIPNDKELIKEETLKQQSQPKSTAQYVQVSSNGVLEKVELEMYLIGVVASEMPYTFEIEALKAQSVAARTFVMQRNLKVDDTTSSQVYKSEQELKEIFEQDYDAMYKRIKTAVDSTKGEVMKYQGSYISALFYSCNNGMSNDASWYYKNEVPYLKSVKSSWDLNYEACKKSEEKSKDEIVRALGISNFSVGEIKYYENGYVQNIIIDKREFSGREIREKLHLRSSCFSFVDQGSSVIINTQGFGHGVGMSQYGADGMAKEGKKYQEILKHYYTGIDIKKMN